MPSWLPNRRMRLERTDAEAEALVCKYFGESYSEALRREREASSDEIAKGWSRVALAVAHKLRSRDDVDPLTRIAMNALFVPDRKPAASRLPRGLSPHRPPDEPKHFLPAISHTSLLALVAQVPRSRAASRAARFLRPDEQYFFLFPDEERAIGPPRVWALI
jgi:hypothetical protein